MEILVSIILYIIGIIQLLIIWTIAKVTSRMFAPSIIPVLIITMDIYRDTWLSISI